MIEGCLVWLWRKTFTWLTHWIYPNMVRSYSFIYLYIYEYLLLTYLLFNFPQKCYVTVVSVCIEKYDNISGKITRKWTYASRPSICIIDICIRIYMYVDRALLEVDARWFLFAPKSIHKYRSYACDKFRKSLTSNWHMS